MWPFIPQPQARRTCRIHFQLASSASPNDHGLPPPAPVWQTVDLRLWILWLPWLMLTGCYDDRPTFPQGTVEGYRPVYTTETAKEISLEDPRSLHHPGKLYVYGKYLLVNEENEGIHVFDNQDPQHPAPLGFIQLLGSQDIAIRNGVLYANHMGDIVALKVTDFQTLTEQGRVPVSTWGLGAPPPGGSYFECIDPAQGIVIRWKKVQIRNPQCYADYF